MQIPVFRRPAARWAITVAAVTALACAGTLPAHAAQTANQARHGLARATVPVPGRGLAGPSRPAGQLTPARRGVRPATVPADVGSNPAISASSYGYVLGLKSYGQLYLTGLGSPGYTGQGMWPDTSPSVVALPGGGYEAAFHGSDGLLHVYGDLGMGSLGYVMDPGSSPSIASVPGGYEIAFQDSSYYLAFAGAGGTFGTGLGMQPGTSPAIAGLAGGGYEAAFQANTNTLWFAGPGGTFGTGLGMQPGTSPAITGLAGGSYEAAFQANTHFLWFVGPTPGGTFGTILGMDPGTNPAITTGVSGPYEAAFQANTHTYWEAGSDGTIDVGYPMQPGTSPGISEANGLFYRAWISPT